MAKLRLLAGMKELLRVNVREHVKPRKLNEQMTQAYDVILPIIRAAVHKRFPESEMKVLRKWHFEHEVTHLRVVLTDGQQRQVVLHDDNPVVMPTATYGQDHDLRYVPITNAADSLKVARYLDLKEEHDAEASRRYQAYNALIDGATYLEDLLEVWPESAAIVPRGGAILALGPDQLETIRKDREERSE